MYQFEDLKSMVRQRFKVDPDNASSTFQARAEIRRKVKKTEFRNLISFNFDGEHGIFINEDDRTFKGFLYIPIYSQSYARQKGWNTMPRFHITKCETIIRQMNKQNFNGHYVFANIPIIDMTDYDGTKKDLEICGYCRSETGYPDINTTQFYERYLKDENFEENFVEEDIPEEYDVNLWGYTQEWAEKSKSYRQSKNFTCENCGIKLDGADGYYLDSHHINGRKTNNSNANLKCLCVLCHSKVDDIHIRNFSTGKARKRLMDFLEIFSSRLEEIGNPYI